MMCIHPVVPIWTLHWSYQPCFVLENLKGLIIYFHLFSLKDQEPVSLSHHYIKPRLWGFGFVDHILWVVRFNFPTVRLTRVFMTWSLEIISIIYGVIIGARHSERGQSPICSQFHMQMKIICSGKQRLSSPFWSTHPLRENLYYPWTENPRCQLSK